VFLNIKCSNLLVSYYHRKQTRKGMEREAGLEAVYSPFIDIPYIWLLIDPDKNYYQESMSGPWQKDHNARHDF
jgi:hypothetical protein